MTGRGHFLDVTSHSIRTFLSVGALALGLTWLGGHWPTVALIILVLVALLFLADVVKTVLVELAVLPTLFRSDSPVQGADRGWVIAGGMVKLLEMVAIGYVLLLSYRWVH